MPTFETVQEPIKESPYVGLPLDALFRGMGYKQQDYDQTYQDLQGQLDQAASTKAYGQDQDVVNQAVSTMNSQLSQFSGALLTDPTTRAKINQLTSTTQQALLPAAIRATQYKTMMDEKKEYEEKGKKYFNPGLDQAEAYYNSGKYDPNAKFISSPGVAPDMGKLYEEAKKIVQPKVRRVQGADGYIYTDKYYDPADMRGALEIVAGSDPNTDKYVNYLWNKSVAPNTDWNEKPNEIIKGASDNMSAAISALNSPKLTPDERTKYLQEYQQARKTRDTYTALLDNPNHADAAKQQSLKDFKNRYFDDGVSASSAHEETEGKLSEVVAKKLDLNNSIAETNNRIYKEQLAAAGLMEDPTTGQLIPGKAEIAGETAGLKKKYTSTGQEVYIHPHITAYHEAISGTDNRVPDEAKEGVTLDQGIISKVFPKEINTGWHQLSNDAFLQNYMDTKKISPNATSSIQPVLASNGRPGVFVKGDKMVMEVADGSHKKYIPINAEDIYNTEYQKATFKEKQALLASREANISGKYSDGANIQKKTVKVGQTVYSDYNAYKKAYEAVNGKVPTGSENELIERWNNAK